MKEIVLVTDFSNNREKKDILRKLIQDLKNKYVVCLNSHFPLSQDIIEDVDYFIYDKTNNLLHDNRFKGLRYSRVSNLEIIYKNYSAPASHVTAILHQLMTSMSYIKSLGFNIVHILEYDSEIIDDKILSIHSDVLKSNQDMSGVVYFDEYRFISNFYTLNLDLYSSEELQYDENKVENIYKSFFVRDNGYYSVERTMLHILFGDRITFQRNGSEIPQYLKIGISDKLPEKEISTVDFTFFLLNGKVHYFVFNRSGSKKSLDLTIDNFHYKNIQMDVDEWRYDSLFDLDKIDTAKLFIDNNLSFDVDFRTEENEGLLEFAQFNILH